MTAKSIHLVERMNLMKPVDRDNQIYESGFWVLSEHTAQDLVDSKIYLHDSQSAPAFFGGTILHWKKMTDGEHEGRILFTFKAESECKGFKTDSTGWAQEMKIVR